METFQSGAGCRGRLGYLHPWGFSRPCWESSLLHHAIFWLSRGLHWAPAGILSNLNFTMRLWFSFSLSILLPPTSSWNQRDIYLTQMQVCKTRCSGSDQCIHLAKSSFSTVLPINFLRNNKNQHDIYPSNFPDFNYYLLWRFFKHNLLLCNSTMGMTNIFP